MEYKELIKETDMKALRRQISSKIKTLVYYKPVKINGLIFFKTAHRIVCERDVKDLREFDLFVENLTKMLSVLNKRDFDGYPTLYCEFDEAYITQVNEEFYHDGYFLSQFKELNDLLGDYFQEIVEELNLVD